MVSDPSIRGHRVAHDRIGLRGARQKNLKNLDGELSLGALTVVTGPSGSGKSSGSGDSNRNSSPHPRRLWLQDALAGHVGRGYGRSGSGKSSLAFETIDAEGQRRYVETLSPDARPFLDRMDEPVVDAIAGIPRAIAIDPTNAVKNSRSSVGTKT